MEFKTKQLKGYSYSDAPDPINLYFGSTTLYAKVYFVMHGLLLEMCIDTRVQSLY